LTKHVQTTQPVTNDLPLATSLDSNPSQEANNTATHVVFTTVLPAIELQKSFSDQTGKFPIQSSCGYNYMMELNDYNSNAILSKPLKTPQAGKLTTAWQSLHPKLQSNGYAPTLHILDNKCLDQLKKVFHKTNVQFQQVPHSHHRNSA
jgi:hypothetical protein